MNRVFAALTRIPQWVMITIATISVAATLALIVAVLNRLPVPLWALLVFLTYNVVVMVVVEVHATGRGRWFR